MPNQNFDAISNCKNKIKPKAIYLFCYLFTILNAHRVNCAPPFMSLHKKIRVSCMRACHWDLWTPFSFIYISFCWHSIPLFCGISFFFLILILKFFIFIRPKKKIQHQIKYKTYTCKSTNTTNNTHTI